jgi:hypothetical protein
MRRFQKSVLLGLVVAGPAAAHALLPAEHAFMTSRHACFTAGASSYRISASAPSPDYRVRIDNLAAAPDLQMRLVEAPEQADFVLVDDVDDADAGHDTGVGAGCGSATLKTIRIDANEPHPDLTIRVAAQIDAPDFKLYVRSSRFSPADAAALFGVMWRATRSRDLAQQR